MMDASSKLQLNVSELKSKYAQLQRDHEDLNLLCAKQKERLSQAESRRNQLIKLFKDKIDKTDKYKTEIESLRKENSSLHSTIQDQNLLIGEYTETIDKLKKENAALKSRRNEPTNVIERGIKQQLQVNGISSHIKGISGTNNVIGHFSHPSFDAPDTCVVIKKKKKKSPLALALKNRYSNLDISGNGVEQKKEKTEANNNKETNGKKRRLFSLEDEMIDLTIGNQD